MIITLINFLFGISFLIAGIKYFTLALKENNSSLTKINPLDLMKNNDFFVLTIISYISLYILSIKQMSHPDFMQSIYISSGIQSIFYLLNMHTYKYIIYIKIILVIIIIYIP